VQTTGLFTTHKVEIAVSKINEPIYLIPFGDVHRSSPMCHEEKWRDFLQWAKNKKRCLFLGMGDYSDLASASERKILVNKDLHDSTTATINALYNSQVKQLVKELGFMNGKLIGLLEGNHYAEFPNGMTSTQMMATDLDTKYLGCSAFIRLVFKYTTMVETVDIWAHHGKGASRLVGGSLNRVQQMAEAAEADIYLMGHDHRKSVGMADRLALSEGNGRLKLRHRKQLYIRTGSFLKGYENNKVSYVADMALSPTNLGVVKIEITPRRKNNEQENRFYLDLHASI